MESEANPNVALKPPPLNSDQLNYLIWRYLQEAGYGEAAVKLQRDWKVEPENLPFAKHIKGQALVSLVQKGLRYHHLSLTIDERGRPLKQINPSTFFFGAESARPASPNSSKEPLYRSAEVPRSASPQTNISSIPKKRETESNGALDPSSASAKRNRRTTQPFATDRNGNPVRKTSGPTGYAIQGMEIDHINGDIGTLRNMRSPSIVDSLHDENVINGIGNDSRMDIDVEVSTPDIAGTGPTVIDPVETVIPLVHTLTNGESIGIQVAPAKIANLAPSTTILSLAENLHIAKTGWRPIDGSLLTVAGEHFCGAWKSPSPNLWDEQSRMIYQDLLDFDETTSISAMAWEPSGSLLAVASYSDNGGQLHLFDGRDLVLTENLPASQRPILCLKWLPSSHRLIGIAPCHQDSAASDDTSSTILLWDFSDEQLSINHFLLTVPEILLDVDPSRHAGNGAVCVSGENAVYFCRTNKELLIEDKWTSPIENSKWDFIKSAWHEDGNATLVAASSEQARLWLPLRNVVKNDAHEAPITALELRPRAFHNQNQDPYPDFATSSMDGTVKVWRLHTHNNMLEVAHKLSIGQGLPIMSLSFSPDGFCLAGASFSKVRIWNAEHGYNQMASWEGSDNEWRGAALRDDDVMSAGGLSSVNGDSSRISTDHNLAWDIDSKKLAFSLISQVAVINFQR